jgi:hypothetical protein
MNVGNTEHRRSRRFRGEVDVDVTDKKGTRRGRAIDVARHGLFVALRELPANRHLVQLRIYLPDGDVQAAATVARSLPGQGVGLALFALSDEAKARWDSFVHRAQESFLQQAAHDAQLLDAATPGTGAPSTVSSAPSSATSGAPASATSGAPASATSGAPRAAPHPSASTFFLRLRTVDRLREYQRLHVEAGGTILFTPALLPAGAPITILVVHPVTQVEFPLAGVVHRAVATLPKRLEILFRHADVGAFERFIDTGARPEAPTKLPLSPPAASFRSDEELEFDIDDAVVSDDPVGWDLKSSVLPVRQAPITHDSIPPSPAGDDDFDLQIDVRDQTELSREGDPLAPPLLLSLSLLPPAPSSKDASPTLVPTDLPADVPTTATDFHLDETHPAHDPGLQPTAYNVHCDRCAVAPYTVLLGPCAGTLGLVADLMPFWDSKAGRVVAVPRLVDAPLRRERWKGYVARGGSGNDFTSLSTLFDAAALAEAPVHPQTDEVLRSTRAIERLAAAAARLTKKGDEATSKVSCPACTKGHLKVQRS